ncbi:MAG TPA: hypothetical protein VGH87_13950 [Polyangiaceae bacterium]|jgi:hypothetical protein
MGSRLVFVAAMLATNTALADDPLEVRLWTSKDPVPAGYHVERSWHPTEIGAGLGMFAAAYIPSLFVATIGYSDPVKTCDASGCHNPYWPFFFPVVGPLASLATMGPYSARSSDWIVGLLAADTLTQATGLVLAGMGFVPRATLVSNASTRVTIAPSGSGVLLEGTF